MDIPVPSPDHGLKYFRPLYLGRRREEGKHTNTLSKWLGRKRNVFICISQAHEHAWPNLNNLFKGMIMIIQPELHLT
jgi:hypothetical protein